MEVDYTPLVWWASFLAPILQGLIVNFLTYAILKYYKNRKKKGRWQPSFFELMDDFLQPS